MHPTLIRRALSVETVHEGPARTRFKLLEDGGASEVTVHLPDPERAAVAERWGVGTRLVLLIAPGVPLPIVGDAPTWGVLRMDPREVHAPAVPVLAGQVHAVAEEIAALLASREPADSPLVYAVAEGVPALAPPHS